MNRKVLSFLLVLILAASAAGSVNAEASYELSSWTSVEAFQSYALAYWVKPIAGNYQPVQDGREFGSSRSGRWHAAIDFLRPVSEGTGYGTPVYAMASGVVTESGSFWAGTDAVAVRNTDGSVLRYCEISTSLKAGDTVTQGQQIGTLIYSGSGLCMLHLELYLGTASGNLGASSSNTYYYVQGNYSRRADLLDPTFLLQITREPFEHVHNWDRTGYCSVCGNFKEPAVANAPVSTGVYNLDTSAGLREYPYSICQPIPMPFGANATVQVTGCVINALGEEWVQAVCQGVTGYLPASTLSGGYGSEGGEQEDDFGIVLGLGNDGGYGDYGVSGGYVDPVVPEPSGVSTVPSANVYASYTDVHEGDYYYNAVRWADQYGIASAYSDTLFGVDGACSRAETVEFLWRSAGCPAHNTRVNPFIDVNVNDSFYDAVMWAIETGITSGTSENTFSPYSQVTRAQAVTFLWNACGKMNLLESVQVFFFDVPAYAWYSQAVTWAVNMGIVSGVSEYEFGPDLTCTRGQMLTFLYRYLYG